MHTEITFLSPSSISRSLRLSSNFLTCAVGTGLVLVLRELRADWAASSVSSRAVGLLAGKILYDQQNQRAHIPLSSKLVILDIDSMRGCESWEL